MLGVLAGGGVAEVDFFMPAAHGDFHGADGAVVVALYGAGEPQGHAVGAYGAVLAQGDEIPAAEGPFQGEAVVAEPQVNFYRAVHAARAERLQLAAELGQGDGLRHALVAVGVIEQVEMLEFFGQGHAVLLRRGRGRAVLGYALMLSAKFIR